MKALALLIVANGTPVIAKKLLGGCLAHPIDGGLRFLDGQPLLGRSKTLRGILLSILATAMAAPLVGLPSAVGAIAGAAAMAGDMISSFVKRRLQLPSGSQALGLDQVPESLLPLLSCRYALRLTSFDIVLGVGLFFIGELALSRLLYKVHVRDRPY